MRGKKYLSAILFNIPLIFWKDINIVDAGRECNEFFLRLNFDNREILLNIEDDYCGVTCILIENGKTVNVICTEDLKDISETGLWLVKQQ